MTEREEYVVWPPVRSLGPGLSRRRDVARNLAAAFNRTTEEEKETRQKILKQLLGSLGEWTELYPNVQFDYGCNTYLGNRCYVNFNSTFLDCAEIRLGMMYLWGPMCPSSPPSIRSWPGSESCGLHRMDGPIPKRPASPLQWEIRFGSGNAVILPGVTIGDDTVIGAGSVVTRHSRRCPGSGKSLPGSPGDYRKGPNGITIRPVERVNSLQQA